MSTERRLRSELGESAFRGIGGRTPRVLLHGGGTNRSLALGEAHLFVSDQETGEVFRIAKTGGVPLVLAQLYRPSAVTLAGDYIYCAALERGVLHERGNGIIVRFPVAGGEVEVLAKGLFGPTQIEVSGDRVAVSCFGPFDIDVREKPTGVIALLTLSDRRVRTLATKQRMPTAVAFVDNQLYWVNMGWKQPSYFQDGAVLRIALDGETTKRTVVRKNLSMPQSFLVDDENVYWATSTSFEHSGPGILYKRPRSGGPAIALSSSYDVEGWLLAQDKKFVYRMSASQGTLYRVPKAGGNTERLMVCDETMALSRGLVVDDERIYWVVQDARGLGGAVWSIAKEVAVAPAPRAAALLS